MALPVAQFVTLFQELKARTKGNPRNLSWLCQNDDGLASLACELNSLATSIARLAAARSERFFPQSSPEFIAAYREYQHEYKDAVEPVSAKKDKEILSAFERMFQEDPEFVQKESAKLGLDLDAPTDFDALKDDPVGLVCDIISVAESVAGWPDDQMYKALGAWRFFEDTIGIDLPAIYRRWKATPITFVPKHVSDRHSLTEPGSLFDTLRQAHRAYVFGCERAAMALCRALMELVLKKHWGIEEDEAYIKEKQRNHGKDPGLKKIIAIAEARYDAKYKLRAHRLLQQKELADDVLHAKRPPRTVSGDEISQFLETLSYLIETAPRLADQ